MRECQLMSEKTVLWNPAMTFSASDEMAVNPRYWLHLLLQKFVAGDICLPRQMGLDEKVMLGYVMMRLSNQCSVLKHYKSNN